MLIKPFKRIIEPEDDVPRTCGIYGARRLVYIFTTRELYENKTFTQCKAVIKNDTVYDGTKALTHAITFKDAYVIRSARYFGKIITPEPGNIRNNDAVFILDNCETDERICIHNDKSETIRLDTNMWSSKLKNFELYNDGIDETSLNYCADFMYSCLSPGEVNSINPAYYTDFDMYVKTGDFTDIRFDYGGHRCPVSKIIDHNTTIQFIDLSRYDTMRLDMFRKLTKAESICDKGLEMQISLKSSFYNIVAEGTTFIYDSDYKGCGKPGVSFKNGIVPFGKYYNKNYLVDNIAGALELFNSSCEDIEKMHGHIKVLYSPSSIGDNFKITFKDYKNSPITLPSEIGNFGEITKNFQAPNTNRITSIDNGFTVDRYVRDVVNEQRHSMDIDFMKEVH